MPAAAAAAVPPYPPVNVERNQALLAHCVSSFVRTHYMARLDWLLEILHDTPFLRRKLSSAP